MFILPADLPLVITVHKATEEERKKSEKQYQSYKLYSLVIRNGRTEGKETTGTRIDELFNRRITAPNVLLNFV